MRPQAVSIICVLAFVGAVAGILLALLSGSIGLDYKIWIIGLSAVQLKAVQGIWNMKKWGVVLFAVKLVAAQLGMMVAGDWSALGMMVPVLMMLILSNYYSDMR